MNKTNNSNIVNSTDLEKGIALTREEITRMQQDLVDLREAAKSSEVDVFNVFTEDVSSFDEAFPNFYETYQKDTGGLIKINKTIEDTHPELVNNLTVDPITRPFLQNFLEVISDFKREDLDTEQTKELCNRLNSIYYSFISRRDSVKIEEDGFIINGTKVTIDIAKLPQYLTEFRKYTDMTIGSVNINPIHLISGAFAYNTILKSYARTSPGPDATSKAYPVSVTPLMRARMIRLFAVFGAPMIMTSILVIAYLKPLATIHVINEVNVKTDSNMGTTNTNKTTKSENNFFLFSFITNYFKENKLLFGVLLFMFILRIFFPYYYNMIVSIPLPTFISFFILWIFGFIFYELIKLYLLIRCKSNIITKTLNHNFVLPWYIPWFIKNDYKVCNEWVKTHSNLFYIETLFLIISLCLLMLCLLLVRIFIL